MFREPWFHILEIREPRGRSMADIAAEIALQRGISLREMRSAGQSVALVEARREAYLQLRTERPDLSSGVVAAYFNRDPSGIRYFLRGGAGRYRRGVRREKPEAA